MRVVVDTMLCEGHGVCVLAAPEVFELDDDDNLTVVNDQPGQELRQAVLNAEASCPKRAIRIISP
jgi:ferredoxin